MTNQEIAQGILEEFSEQFAVSVMTLDEKGYGLSDEEREAWLIREAEAIVQDIRGQFLSDIVTALSPTAGNLFVTYPSSQGSH